ncbi:hypothetical protein EV197_2337 [Aquimarina brevivitae]|uniref:Uncharacterized protein n=1 Tax=Aquimarina brevivitae TaxID=323412 RepID=A0A4Q7P1M4_9FLAO|nr:hypothetical protein EV197_2337 [Aquimarina brevivitae]
MKRLVLPVLLIAFAVVCLCIFHLETIDNRVRETTSINEESTELVIQKAEEEQPISSLD